MAVFGMQLIITMVMASVLTKVIPHYSLAQLLLCRTGLYYYLHPSDEELKTAMGVLKKTKSSNSSNSKSKGGKNTTNSTHEEEKSFNVPKNIDISLNTSPVSFIEVMGLRYYSEYQWLIDFSLCSAIVFLISEIYTSFVPLKGGEINLSMLWCLLVIGFSLKLMFSLTKMYFHGSDSGGEKSMVILSFFIYLLIALGMLIVSEEKLDLGLDLAYSSFNQSAAAFLKAQGLDSEGPASKVTFKIIIAFICAFIGAFFTFPGLRVGRMHFDSLKHYGNRTFLKLLFHASFMAPILLVLLWIKPISRNYFTQSIFQGYSKPIMNPMMFDILRLCLVVFVGLIRLSIMPLYLQSYLNMANERLIEQRKETGKISNKEMQKKIARVFYYLCVVTLQYAAPIILCIFLSFMCKTLGGLEWKSLIVPTNSTHSTPSLESLPSASPLPLLQDVESLSQASKMLTLSLEEIKKIFTSEFYMGVLGFATWWCVFSWFLSGTFGVLYQTYFTRG